MSTPLSSSYAPHEVEPRWYALWKEQGYFRGVDTGVAGEAFCITIPPPNVTGSLHMGHALTNTIQDALTRRARMQGKNALWLPGTDHAGIATQVVVERLLRFEGTNRHELGREKFLERVWQWKGESGNRIYQQLEVLGSSLDWEREAFTMNERFSRAVREAFVRLYEEGLIYRSNRLVNWCPDCRSVISDLEVDREDGAQGELFSFAYPLEDGTGEIVVATTRPETILGDTAVAVHPDDERYKHLVGKRLKCPFAERTIPVIADSILVDMSFGTGAVKVTPAHDFNDYETGKRHGLEELNIFEPDGKLNALGGPFAGMDRFAARKEVKKALDARGLARGGKQHKLALAKCSRSGTVLEPMLSPQWYVKTKPLAEPAIAAVQGDAPKVKITPEEWRKVYLNWMENIQDWCISRQLWWGHQIPAWFCGACSKATVARETPTKCAHCGDARLEQDKDVLDTWFSSALWPFATLGWPEQSKSLETFYPNSVMETGYDILFFWVARMMMFGIHFMKDVPFREVLLHGMVCDERGDKMSKVKCNVIDPLDLIHGASMDAVIDHASPKGSPRAEGEKLFKKAYPSVSEMKDGFAAHGADAVRFYLATFPPQAKRINLQLRQLDRARNFANKIWNATRYALPYLEPLQELKELPEPTALSLADRWVLSRLAAAVREVEEGFESFRLDECTGAARRFFWDELCDWYLEFTKPVFNGGAEDAQVAARATLGRSLETAFRLLHPFMPFLTEELWQRLPPVLRSARADGSAAPHLLVARYPHAAELERDLEAERAMEQLQAAIVGARNIRGELGIKPRDAIALTLRAEDAATRAVLEAHRPQILQLTIASELTVEDAGGPRPKGCGYATSRGVEVLVPLAGLIDPKQEAQRLERELEKAGKELEKADKQLSVQSYLERAPAEEVARRREEREALALRLTRLREALQTVQEA